MILANRNNTYYPIAITSDHAIYFCCICITNYINYYFKATKMNTDIYQFKATSLKGEEINLSNYKGKTLLIVNTASKCGLTPQLSGLEKLYQQYKDCGLIILGFPCNQFANQEPGEPKDIEKACIINYGVSFPMFAKIDVNGTNAHPLFNYLKSELKGTFGKKIKWNFTKFLISSNGKPLKRFAPITSPQKIEQYLATILKQK